MNSTLRGPVAVFAALSLAGCSVLNPEVLRPKIPVDPNVEKHFAEASEHALTLFRVYGDGRWEMRQYSLWSGAVLAALGLAGLGLAIFQAPNNALLGVGFAGAGVGGLRAFVPFDTRRQVYANGQKAIVCSAIALSLGTAIAIPESDLASENRDTPLQASQDESDVAVAQRSVLKEDLRTVSEALNTLISPLPSVPSDVRAERNGLLSAVVPLAQANTAVARRFGALESSTTSLVAQWNKLVAIASPSLTDTERARLLMLALIAIDLAVQDQLDRADVSPDKALQVAGSTVGPWLKTFADNVAEVRKQTRRWRNDAQLTANAIEDSGVDSKVGSAQLKEVEASLEKAKEVVDKVDTILAKIWGLITLPAECYNGFAGGLKQSGEPPEGS